MSSHPWHTLDKSTIFSLLNTSIHGLNDDDVTNALQKYGHNLLPKPKATPAIIRFFKQFNNLLIYVLLTAALITLFLNKWTDAAVILFLVFLDAIIGYIQEDKAEKALNSIQTLLSLQANIIRNNKRLNIAAHELVPGDIILLEAGDKVPADIRLISTNSLHIDESLLTGESIPVEKNTKLCSKKSPIAARNNMAFSGTLVASGQGTGIVVATGRTTELGHIGELVTNISVISTPLLQKIAVFSRWLSLFIFLLAVCIFLYGFLIHHYSFDDMLMTAVGIAVAAIPEGLPVILTITLAIGVQRMAHRHAIIRQLPAVETLGSVTVICSDKTGTLTRNEMTVEHINLAKTSITVSDNGYLPKGIFSIENKEVAVDQYPECLELCKAGVLCNTAQLIEENDTYTIEGDPTEGALLVLGVKAGLELETLKTQLPQIDMIPFESKHRLMATRHKIKDNAIIYIKGAPEAIFSRCDTQQIKHDLTPLDQDMWRKKVHALTSQGYRVLAVASKKQISVTEPLNSSSIAKHFTLLGIVGMIDPPREDALAAIKECQSAGIKIKMITGDHQMTARAIASKMGIGDHLHVLTDESLETMDQENLTKAIESVDVFARTSPEHKLRLVEILQSQNHIVAMTGDGVNDSPALKRANIGIAMGLKGSEAAKEVSEMVLTDDNFSSIVAAIKEGRTVYDNLKKVILFLLPINVGESGSLIVATLLGYALPITPLQILWVNMISSVTLTMALAFEPPEPNIMQRPPTSVKEPLISAPLIWRMVYVGIIFLVAIFWVFTWGIKTTGSLETARTLTVNTLVILEIFYLFSSRYIHGPSFTLKGILGTKAIFIAVSLVFFLQWLFTYTNTMQKLFNTNSLLMIQLGVIAAIGIISFVLFEIEKQVYHFLLRK